MRRILKFKLEDVGVTDEGYRAAVIHTSDRPWPLAVDFQGYDPVVWVEATPEKDGIGYVSTMFLLVMTGEIVPEGMTYVGTAQHPTLLNGGPLVIHVYQVGQ